jgi:amino acid adenylation domain-containing protein
MNILLIGEDAAGMQTLQALRRSNHRIVAVMACPSRQNRAGASLWNLAGRMGFPTWQAQLVKDPDFAEQIRKEEVDLILNVHSLFLIHKKILTAPRLGSYNLHPAPLPRYAGLNSVCWAIYHGEHQHGVTLHKMVPEIDAGPIVYQELVSIGSDETGLSLTTRCVNAGVPLVLRLLEVAAQDSSAIPFVAQDLSKREYFGREIPQGGNLSWELPACRVVDFIRACDFLPFPSPWGHPRTGLHGEELGIVKSQLTGIPVDEPVGTVGEASEAGVEVACGDEWILVREVLQNGRYLPAQEVLKKGNRLEPSLECTKAEAVGTPLQQTTRPQQVKAPQVGMAYWQKQLAGRLPVLEWPSDRLRPPSAPSRQAVRNAALSADLRAKLQALSEQESATTYMALAAGFAGVLHRYTGEEDIVLGGAAGEALLPLRIDLSGNPTFLELLRRVRDVVAGASAYGSVKLDELVAQLQPASDPSRHSFFQIAVAPLAGGAASASAGKLDLLIEIEEASGISARVTYNPDLFEAATISRALGHWRMLLEGAAADPARHLLSLPLLTQAERNQILVEWNATGQTYQLTTIHALCVAQAQRTPDAVAVEMDGRRLTFREVDRQSNQLAQHLRALGVGPDVLVGLCVERSPEMVVALLGILKAGGAYVPLDPAFPKQRLELMLSDAKPAVVVTEAALLDLVARDTQLVVLDRDWERIARQSDARLEETSGPNNLAYVLYTSGSTGKPKGVQIEHRCVANFLASMQREPGLTAKDTLVAVTTLSFDIAGLEIYLPLITGAKIVVASAETARDGVQLLSLLQRSRASFLQATPATWRMLASCDAKLPGLKAVCGGEALPTELATALLWRVGSLWNLYGPTETTIWSTCCRVSHVDGPLSIGRPIANTQTYVLDAHQNPVPVGAIGDLYIGGAGVGRGYLHRQELTAEKFIADPFSSHPGARLYRTGDLARYRADGSIDFLGRSDHQVKIRGFRIELGEIEAVLEQHGGVNAAVALVREDTPGDARLVAYVVPREGAAPTMDDLRQLLMQRLPRYMVPGNIVFLDNFPLTPNGKVDRKAFPAPDVHSAYAEEILGPRTATEVRLVSIWEKLLGIHPIGIQSSFFDLGGHSLLVTNLLIEIECVFGRKLSVAAIFQAETVEQLAAVIDQCEFEDSSLVIPIQKSGSNPPFFCLGAGPMFRALARRFGPDQPFLGVRADPSEWTHLSTPYLFEDIAGVFLRKIRAYQPAGPYYIGGFCLTGVVAYEVARQLIAQGEEVKVLVLFYSHNPAFFRTRSRTDRLQLQYELTKFHLATVCKLRGKDFVSYAKDRLEGAMEKLRLSIAPQPGASFLPELEQIGVAAALNYCPTPSPIPTVLFRPAKDPHGKYWDRQYDWGTLVTASLDVHITPGDHSSMFREPHVEALAEKMKSYLGQAAVESTVAG